MQQNVYRSAETIKKSLSIEISKKTTLLHKFCRMSKSTPGSRQIRGTQKTVADLDMRQNKRRRAKDNQKVIIY